MVEYPVVTRWCYNYNSPENSCSDTCKTAALVGTSTRGGRPATTISRPNHILLIFSSEPPFFKFLNLKDKAIF